MKLSSLLFLLFSLLFLCAAQTLPPATTGRPAVKVWLAGLSGAETSSVAEICREAVSAVLQRRPQKVPAGISGDVQFADNGLSLAVFKDGKMLAAGSAVGGKIPENARVASGEAVYGLEIPDFAAAQLVVSVFSEPQAQENGSAPFYKYNPGIEGYMAEFGGRKAIVGPVECVINKLSWKDVLLKLAGAVAQKREKPYSKGELVQLLADPGFRLSVMPARNILSPGNGQPAESLNLASLTANTTIDNALCRQALSYAMEWFKLNQSPAGEFPENIDLVQGKSAGNADACSSAFAALAMGKVWKQQQDKPVRMQGLRCLDQLLISRYLDSPGQDFGYFKEGNEVNLASSAIAVQAILDLEAGAGNAQISRSLGRLEKFLAVMYKSGGNFRPWFYPADRKSGEKLFSAMAMYSLIKSEPKKYAPQFLPLFSSQPPETLAKSPQSSCWQILAACEVYASTRQSAAAKWAFTAVEILGRENKGIIDFAREKKQLPQVCGLMLHAYCEVLYLQKLQLGTGGDAEKQRLLVLRRAAVACLREIAALQICPGAQSLLLRSPKASVGAFCRAPGELSASLEGMSQAVIGLSRAVDVLEPADYAAGSGL